jgi:hypothetical protein
LTEHGTLQAYYFDKQRLIDLAHQQPITPDGSIDTPIALPQTTPSAWPDRVRGLAARCLAENGGKFTLGWLQAIGLGQQEARRTQDDWAGRGWIDKDKAHSNAYVLALSVCSLLSADPGGLSTDKPDKPDKANKPG